MTGLELDPIMCRAHGLCAELLPELIRLDEWGYPILTGTEVPAALRSEAKAAAAACPPWPCASSAAEKNLEAPVHDSDGWFIWEVGSWTGHREADDIVSRTSAGTGVVVEREGAA